MTEFFHLSHTEIMQLRTLLPRINDQDFDEFIQLINKLIIIQLTSSPNKTNDPLSYPKYSNMSTLPVEKIHYIFFLFLFGSRQIIA